MDSLEIHPNPERDTNEHSKHPNSGLNPDDEKWLTNHLKQIRKLITDEALRIAKEKDRSDSVPAPLDVAEATKAFAPGERFPLEPPFLARIAASLSGVTVVSAALAVVFGFLGIWLGPNGSNPSTAATYFDIAKIFAGAIVGSTGAGLALGSRRK